MATPPKKSQKTKKQERSSAGAFLPLLVFFGLAAVVAGTAWFFTKDRAPEPKSRVTERQRVEDGLGWGSELLVDKKRDEPAVIRFMLRDQDRKPLVKAKVQVTFTGGPPRKRVVVQGMLKEDEPGVYRSSLALPHSGIWQVQVNAQAGENAYQNVQEMTLP
jgi:hypothetical protein